MPIKTVPLKGKPIGRHYRLPCVKRCPSSALVPMEQDIKRCCEQRAAERSHGETSFFDVYSG